jgi:hypothetical protein
VDLAKWSSHVEVSSTDRAWVKKQTVLFRADLRGRFPNRRPAGILSWPLGVAVSVVLIIAVALTTRWVITSMGNTPDVSTLVALTIAMAGVSGLITWRTMDLIWGSPGIHFRIVSREARPPWYEHDFTKGVIATLTILGGAYTIWEFAKQVLRPPTP